MPALGTAEPRQRKICPCAAYDEGWKGWESYRPSSGRGGSGAVFASTLAGRPVAVKLLQGELDDDHRARFQAEAEALEAIDHPNVVAVLGTGATDEGRPYIVMERLEGESLAERLERGPLDPAEARRRFFDVAQAVSALHQAGYLHRDIKPENVMCCDDRAVLLDLGIAKRASGPKHTATGLVRGTPDYMAPERAFGAAASVASDVYELALLLYFCLAGRAPWNDPTDPSERHDPAPLDRPESAAILTALSVNPARRPQGIGELVDAVMETTGAVTPERVTQAVAPVPQPKPEVVAPRWRMWLAAAALASVGLLGGRALAAERAAALQGGLMAVTLELPAEPRTAPAPTAPQAVAEALPSPVPEAPKPQNPTPPTSPRPTGSVRLNAVAQLPHTDHYGPACLQFLASRCNEAAVARMHSTEPCRTARASLAQSARVMGPEHHETMCRNLLAASR